MGEKNKILGVHFGRRAKEKFNNLFEQYLNERKVAKDSRYVKMINRIIKHINNLLLKFEKQEQFTKDEYIKYWLPIAEGFGLSQHYVWENKQAVLIRAQKDPNFITVLKPILVLEAYLWEKCLQGRIPSKPWQLAIIVRLSVLMKYATNQYLKNLQPLQKYTFSSRLGRCWVELKKNPQIHTDKITSEIMELYKLALTSQLSAATIGNKIAKLHKLTSAEEDCLIKYN